VAEFVLDTSLSVGVSPLYQFVAEDEMEGWLEEGDIDLQVVFQPDDAYHHSTPDWNPFLGNDYVAKVLKLFPGRALGLATVQVWHQADRAPGSKVERSPALEELDRCILDLGMVGLRMNPIQHNYQFNNADVVWPVLERLSELQQQVGRQLLVSVHAYGDSLNNSPEALAHTARTFPDLLFLMQHAAFVWGYGTVSDVTAPVENVLLDLSTMPQQSVVRKAYDVYGPDKFCIGTDGPIGSHELKRAIIRDFARDETEARKLLGETLAERLGINTGERSGA
jgi:predicted TIM-barrel fold metal-dependent hydrolase